MIDILLKAVTSVAMKLVMSVASEKFIEWLLFNIAEKIVKSTKTPHDDEFYEKIKAAYYSKDTNQP